MSAGLAEQSAAPQRQRPRRGRPLRWLEPVAVSSPAGERRGVSRLRSARLGFSARSCAPAGGAGASDSTERSRVQPGAAGGLLGGCPGSGSADAGLSGFIP